MTYAQYLKQVAAQSKRCLEEEQDSRCPSWCIGDHLTAVAEGCDPSVMYEHHGLEQGDLLYELRGLMNPDRVLREGAQHWRAWAERTQGFSGWDTAEWLMLEVGCRDENGHSEFLTLRMTAAEMRHMSRALEHIADRASLD